MAKPPKKPKPEEIETEPDAWDRFKGMMDKIVPPKRRTGEEGDAGLEPRASNSRKKVDKD